MLAEDGVISKEVMCGLTTDTSDGGGREVSTEEMINLNRCCHIPNCFAVTCVLNAMNRLVQSPCEKFLGNDGIGQRNPIQLLQTCCALQKYHEMVEFRVM